MRRLRELGYRVNLRMNVGHFRIGMVVEGEDEKRLALECDGDRYSSLDSLTEDAARQSILERLGWQFMRIRGTAFYRDPDGALRRVFDRLKEIGIEPVRDGVARADEGSGAALTLIEELEDMRVSEPGLSQAVVEHAPAIRALNRRAAKKKRAS